MVQVIGRILSADVNDVRRLVDRYADFVIVDRGNDRDTERILRDDFGPLVSHEVEDAPRTPQIIGLNPRRNPVIVVEGDHSRVE